MVPSIGDSIFVIAVDQGSPIAVVVTNLNQKVPWETSWHTYAWMEANTPDVEDAAQIERDPLVREGCAVRWASYGVQVIVASEGSGEIGTQGTRCSS